MRTHRKTWVPAMVRKVAAVTLLLQMSLTEGSSKFMGYDCCTQETGRWTILPSSECWPATVGEPSGQSTGHGSMPPLTSLRLGVNLTDSNRFLTVRMSSQDASLGNSKQLKLKLMESSRFPESSGNSLCLSIDVQGATSQERGRQILQQSQDIAVTVTLPTNRTFFFLEMAVPESKLSPRRYFVKIDTRRGLSQVLPVVAVTTSPGKGLLYISPPKRKDIDVTYGVTLIVCSSHDDPDPEEAWQWRDVPFDQWGFSNCSNPNGETELDFDKAAADSPLEVPLEDAKYLLWVDATFLKPGSQRVRLRTLRTPTFRSPARELKHAMQLGDPQYSTQELRSAGTELGNSENVPGLTAVISGATASVVTVACILLILAASRKKLVKLYRRGVHQSVQEDDRVSGTFQMSCPTQALSDNSCCFIPRHKQEPVLRSTCQTSLSSHSTCEEKQLWSARITNVRSVSQYQLVDVVHPDQRPHRDTDEDTSSRTSSPEHELNHECSPPRNLNNIIRPPAIGSMSWRALVEETKRVNVRYEGKRTRGLRDNTIERTELLRVGEGNGNCPKNNMATSPEDCWSLRDSISGWSRQTMSIENKASYSDNMATTMSYRDV